MTFSSLHQGSEKINFPAGKTSFQESDDLIVGKPYHFFARSIGISVCCACIQESQEIIYFRDCAYSRPRVFVRGFLFD